MANIEILQEKLCTAICAENSFDLKQRRLTVAGKKAICTYLIGFCDSVILERAIGALMRAQDKKELGLQEVMENALPFCSTSVTGSADEAADEILRGSAVVARDGDEGYLVLDIRSFALRSNDEPEKDRSLRGPHIGFNESMVGNLTQIRRYLRTGQLATKRYILGTVIRNEVAVLYLAGKANERLIERLEKKLKNADLPNLSMTQETLANYLFPRKRWNILNPFPRVRYTERPDVVAATLMEGKIAILCDNSPAVILLPESLFDFFEETDDYYFPPVVATYLRFVRIFIFFASVYLIPLWLLIVQNGNRLPDTFSFILTEGDYSVPLFLQFLIIELAIDGLKMASLNTPNTLSNSFSVIGGLLLGEYAVKSGWFVPQTILYSAFTSIANFIPTNYELGYSFKFIRVSLIVLVEFFGVGGLLAGSLLWLLILISTRSVTGRGYMYPFIPFDRKGIMKILIRTRKGREQDTD